MARMIDTTGLSNFVMKDGDGPAATLKKDGLFKLLVKKSEAAESQAKNDVLRITFIVQDDDIEGAKGAVVYKTLLVSGEIDFGEGRKQKNIDNLGQILTSAGRPADYLASLAAKGKVDLEQIAKELQGATVYAWVHQTESINGNTMVSEPKYYVRETVYNERKASGSNFRRDPNAKTGNRRTTGATGGGAAPSNGVHTPPATDALAGDV